MIKRLICKHKGHKMHVEIIFAHPDDEPTIAHSKCCVRCGIVLNASIGFVKSND